MFHSSIKLKSTHVSKSIEIAFLLTIGLHRDIDPKYKQNSDNFLKSTKPSLP